MNSQTQAQFQWIPLAHLRASKRNVRKMPPSAAALEELAESIAQLGLMQNLIVMPTAVGDQWEVVAGARRLAALKRLVKQKRRDAEAPVLCQIVAAANATTVSLTENVQREAMHPADQFEAFAKLLREGRSVEAVAADFGITPLVVRRRLKLANVSPRLLAAYREGEATLDQLMALAVVDDHAAQEAAFFEAPAWRRTAEALREHLTVDEIDADRDPVARFVGVSAYEAAGGLVRRDLFADDQSQGFLADVDLLDRLARERLESLAADTRAKGWAWVDVAPRASSAELAGFQRAPMTRREPTVKEAKRRTAIATALAKLDARIDELESIEDDAEREATQAEYDGVDAERDRLWQQQSAFEDTLVAYSADVIAAAGAVVSVDRQGDAVVHAGLLRAEDAQALKRRQRETTTETDAVEKAEQKPGISEALARRLSSHRTAALQIELSQQPRIALVALIHALALRLLYDEYGSSSIVRISGTPQSRLAAHAPDIDASPAALAFAEQLDAWQRRLPTSSDALFSALLALSDDDLLALLALCVANTLDAVVSRENDGCADALAQALSLDMRKWWTATADSYFSSITKPKIIKALQAFAPAQVAHLTNVKKGLMATEASRLAAGTGWLPDMLRSKA